MNLPAGVTPAGSGKAAPSTDVTWSILGHTYWLKAEAGDCFAFETLDPPGTFVPPHIHPTQDEFIYMLEGRSISTSMDHGPRRASAISCACPVACHTATTTAAAPRPAPCSG
jgi:quercetin dioxygenase-like cupin family protein